MNLCWRIMPASSGGRTWSKSKPRMDQTIVWGCPDERCRAGRKQDAQMSAEEREALWETISGGSKKESYTLRRWLAFLLPNISLYARKAAFLLISFFLERFSKCYLFIQKVYKRQELFPSSKFGFIVICKALKRQHTKYNSAVVWYCWIQW